MTRTIDRDGGDTTSGGPRDAALSGWRWSNVPLPEAHLGVGFMSLVLSVLWPRRITWEPARRVGWPLIIGGVVLGSWATRAAGTTDLARPDQLVTDGPYALSRHPMYVAWTAVLLGMALAMRATWLLRLMPPLAVLVHREARREEDRLTRVFGVEYQAYTAQVRRYL